MSAIGLKRRAIWRWGTVINSVSYSSVNAILKTGLDRVQREPFPQNLRPRKPTSAAALTINSERTNCADPFNPRPDAYPRRCLHGGGVT